MKKSNKLIIGCAGFSAVYGINKNLPPTYSEITDIFDFAFMNGIKILDTAQAYGDSNKIISKASNNRFEIITKLIDAKSFMSNSVNFFFQSLLDLNINQYHSVLFHRSSDLFTQEGKNCFDFLNEMKLKNKIKNIGVSIYSPKELDDLIEIYNFDVIQAPLNIADRRISKYWKQNYSKLKNTKLHARSIYLQGLLLKSQKEIEPKFKELIPLLDEINTQSRKLSISKSALLLNYVCSESFVENIVIGFWSVKEIQEALKVISGKELIQFSDFEYDFNEKIIDPRNW